MITALTLGLHHAVPMRSGGWACTRAGADFPVWRHDRDAALAQLRRWAAEDRPAAKAN